MSDFSDINFAKLERERKRKARERDQEACHGGEKRKIVIISSGKHAFSAKGMRRDITRNRREALCDRCMKLNRSLSPRNRVAAFCVFRCIFARVSQFTT